MKQERLFPSIQVTKKQEASLHKGHPWVYEDEIIKCNEDIPNGSLVDVLSIKGQYLGTGLYSVHSKIRVRILDQNANEKFDDEFFKRRVKYAINYRHILMPDDFNVCRLIHGESDGLPGVTVDKYEDILVSEILSFGMEQRKEVIYQTLIEYLQDYGVKVRGIYERNEGALRLKEGLKQEKGWYLKADDTKLIIKENDIKYLIDIENGQKTGFFLDQKYNRLAIRNVVKDSEVLDCCTHIGSFSFNAIKGGANHVTAMDISEDALNNARENAKLNNMQDKIDFVCADVFEYLPKLIAEHKKYDVVFLDPPAFTKSRKTFNNARNGYEKINMQAMRIVKKGGFLATSSCSHFMPMNEFKKMLEDAANKVNVHIKIVEERHASKDHPILMHVDETDYLKFLLVQII